MGKGFGTNRCVSPQLQAVLLTRAQTWLILCSAVSSPSILSNRSLLLPHHNRSRNSPGLAMRRTSALKSLPPQDVGWTLISGHRIMSAEKKLPGPASGRLSLLDRDTMAVGSGLQSSAPIVTSLPMPAESQGHHMPGVW